MMFKNRRAGMRQNRVKKVMREGELAIGTYVAFSDPQNVAPAPPTILLQAWGSSVQRIHQATGRSSPSPAHLHP